MIFALRIYCSVVAGSMETEWSGLVGDIFFEIASVGGLLTEMHREEIFHGNIFHKYPCTLSEVLAETGIDGEHENVEVLYIGCDSLHLANESAVCLTYFFYGVFILPMPEIEVAGMEDSESIWKGDIEADAEIS